MQKVIYLLQQFLILGGNIKSESLKTSGSQVHDQYITLNFWKYLIDINEYIKNYITRVNKCLHIKIYVLIYERY